jgi:hypothetical protein
MKKNILLLSALLFLAASVLCNADAADKVKVLTNEDLKKYGVTDKENSNDSAIKQTPPPQKNDPSREPPKDPDKESWCTKATRLKGRVDEANRKVQQAEKQRSDASMAGEVSSYSSTPIAVAEENLAKARQDLETAEKELSDFEQLAYSQGIPPGWLRCQFD